MLPDRQDHTKNLRRHSQIEFFEERLTFSASPLTDLPVAEPPPLEQFGQLDTDAAPDFVLNETLESGLELSPFLSTAHDVTGVDVVHEMGLDGSGQTVVVIDSGVAWDHEYLGGGLGSSHKVVGGWDFTENDANPYDDGPRGFHGTHVTGIIGSDHPTHTGVAPGADIVSLRVFNDAGEGMFSWVEDALQWVHDHKDEFANPITTVNLSLGASWNDDAIPSWATLEDELQQLEASGIFIAVAAGNSFGAYNETGLAYPAASPHVVPVASVTDDGQLSSFSQRNERVLLAPGQRITSTIPDHSTVAKDGRVVDFGVASGTSMASPYVAGSAVLVRQAMIDAGYANIDQDLIYDQLLATADPVFDSVTNATYYQINVLNAIQQLSLSDDYGDTTSTAHQAGVVQDVATVQGGIQSAGDRDYFAFTAADDGVITFQRSGAATNWLAPAGAIVNGNQATLQVTRGQQIVIGVQGESLGSYSLDVQLERSTAENLGHVNLIERTGLSVQGEARFEVTATRTGVLAARVDSGLSVEIWKDGARWSGDASTGQVAAQAGETYEIRVLGSENAYDLTVSNQIAVAGNQVTVYGTANNDTFQWNAATGDLTVSGIEYDLTGKRFRIAAGAGVDSLHATGHSWNASIATDYVSLFHIQDGARLTGADLENVTVQGSGGRLMLHGSSTAADQAMVRDGQATLSNATHRLQGDGFDSVYVYGAGGNDTLRLEDSQQNDHFLASDGYARLTGGYTATAYGFETVMAHAIHGGADTVTLRDSAADDQAFASYEYAEMRLGTGRVHTAWGFEKVVMSSRDGDTAALEDSPADDRLSAQPDRVALSGSGYSITVTGFGRVNARALHGGSDVASMYDSAGDDRYSATAGYASMRGDSFHNTARDFEQMVAFAYNGGYDTASIYDSPANDHLTISSFGIRLQSSDTLLSARRFESLRAQSISGGHDTVTVQQDWSDSTQTGSRIQLDSPHASGESSGFLLATPLYVLSQATTNSSVVDVYTDLPVVGRNGVDHSATHQAHASVFADESTGARTDEAVDSLVANPSDGTDDAVFEESDLWNVDSLLEGQIFAE